MSVRLPLPSSHTAVPLGPSVKEAAVTTFTALPVPGRFVTGTVLALLRGAYPPAAPLFVTFSGVNPSSDCLPAKSVARFVTLDSEILALKPPAVPEVLAALFGMSPGSNAGNCAWGKLPIVTLEALRPSSAVAVSAGRAPDPLSLTNCEIPRSEERRVGKEGRSRW